MRKRTFFRSFLMQACWNEERMQNLGFAYCMEPWLARIYGKGDPRGLEARQRHLEFFNTQPYMAGIILGVVARMEEEAAREKPDWSRVTLLKSAMASALAGIGDSFFWGALRPLAAACGLATGWLLWRAGVPEGPSAACGLAGFLLLFNVPALRLRWRGIRLGYERGEAVVADIQRMNLQKQVANLKRAGRCVSGALAAVAVLAWPAGDHPLAWVLAERAAILGGCLGLGALRLSGARVYGAVLLGALVVSAAGR